MANPVTVDVKNGRLDVTTMQHVDLIAHVYHRDSDRGLLTAMWERIGNAERGGA